MKIRTIIAAAFMTAAFMTAGSFGAFAQAKAGCPSAGQGEQAQQEKCCPIKDLTPEQKTQIETLKMTFMKEQMALKNQIAEKKTHLRTLSTVDEPNMAEINKTIDEMYVIKADLAKKKAAHMQSVRKVLTPEQRMKFDMMHKDMDGEGCGMGHDQNNAGMGCQHGAGQGQGCQTQKAGCSQQGAGEGCQTKKAGCCPQGAGQGQGDQTQKAGCSHQGAGQGAGNGHEGCTQHQK